MRNSWSTMGRHLQSIKRAQGVLLALMGVPAMCLTAIVAVDAQSAPETPARQEPKPVVHPQPLAFEVASVKTAADPEMVPMFCIVPCAPGERLTVVGSRVDIRFMSLYKLIVTAYGIKPYQVSGPDWMRSPKFDIAAKMPDGVSKARLPEMLQALLAERFKLSIHRESKEQPVYALVVGKNGPKLKESAAAADALIPEGAPPGPGSRELYTPQGEAHIDANGNPVIHGRTVRPDPGRPRTGWRQANGAVEGDHAGIRGSGSAT